MKTRTFVLNNSITARRIKQLITRIELCKSKNINLHLCSVGGETWMADIFSDFTHRANKKINLIGSGMMCSACVNIFMEAKGKKSLQPFTIALIHLNSFTIDEARNLMNNKSYDSILIKELKKVDGERLNRYVKVFDLTTKEISILKNGGDLGLDYERLKKALPKINKLKI